MTLSAFGEAFLENLKDLTTPERRSIVTLKDLAFENTGEASNVVQAIRTHVKQCPAAHRLPALYLVDCMLKNEPCPPVYSQQLGGALLEIFSFMWDNAPDNTTRATLARVCKLWGTMVEHLDKKVVQACVAYMVPAGQASTSGGAPAVGGVLLPPGYQGYPVTQPPRVPAPYGRPPVQLGNGGMMGARVAGQQTFAPQPAMPCGYGVPQAARSAPQAVLPPQPVLLPMPSYMQPQQLGYIRPAAPFNSGAAPVLLSMPGTLMPPQLFSMPPAVVPLPAVQQQTPPPASPPTGPSGSPQAADRPRSTEFPGPQALKELDSTAVEALKSASSRSRPAFLDAAFLRNKRRANQEFQGAASRQWYPSVDLWLVGASSAEAADQVEAEEPEVKEEKQYFVEEDPSQPECAISGEPFERFYDPDSDKWCYQDAVVLTGDEAAKYGVMDGSIVKVQCLAGAPSKLQMATLRTAAATAAAADDLRSAAAQTGTAVHSSQPAVVPTQASVLAQPALVSALAPAVPAAATTAHLAQPYGAVKEEPQASLPVGAVVESGLGGGAAELTAGGKRLASTVDTGTGMLGAAGVGHGFSGAKRVKLEVQ